MDFQSLPRALAREIAEAWLDAHAVAMLDRAHCSKDCRAQFLEMLSGICLRNMLPSKQPRRIGKVRNVINLVQWLQKMNVGVAAFIVPVVFGTERASMLPWMQKMGNSVNSVCFERGWRRKRADNLWEDIAQCFPNVVAIDVSELAVGFPDTHDKAVNDGLCFASSVWNLQTVVVTNIRLSDTSLATIAQRCPNLVHLDVRGCGSLTSASVCSVVLSCPALLYLDANRTQVDDSVVAAVGLHCPLLQHLDFAGTNVSGGSFGPLAYGCPELIYLASCTLDSDLLAVGRGCPKLQTLLSPGDGVGDDGVIAVAFGCPRIRELDLSDAENITSEGLCALAQHSRRLQVLQLCGCTNLDDEGVIDVVYNCHQLRELHLTYCGELTDDSADAIANYGRNLQVLNIEGCLEISAEGIRLIGKHCYNLRTVRNLLVWLPCSRILNELMRVAAAALHVGACQHDQAGAPLSVGSVHAQGRCAALGQDRRSACGSARARAGGAAD
jgi:hypothetical protein